jgi:hypothetical protein
VVTGKTGVLNRVSAKHSHTVEGVVGLLSGIAIAVFGTLFFMTSLNTTVF